MDMYANETVGFIILKYTIEKYMSVPGTQDSVLDIGRRYFYK